MVRAIEAILLVWGTRDDVIRMLPVDGYLLYGEYDFIAKVEFKSEAELMEFERRIHEVLGSGRFKLMPIRTLFERTDGQLTPASGT